MTKASADEIRRHFEGASGHLSDEERASVFRKLCLAFRPGGWLWFSDLVSPSSPVIRSLLARRYGPRPVEVGEELGLRGPEFRDAVFRGIAERDTPRPLLYQADLLPEVGVSAVEVLHLNTGFATFGAAKAS